MRRLLDTLGGLLELLRLGILTRFDFKGDYWSWRLHTAFGRGFPGTRGEMVRAVLEYGRWVHRMRRDS